MEGHALTVRGPVAPDDLGLTFMHEHLFNDIRDVFAPGPDAPETELAHWQEKLSLENLQLAREAKPIADNYLLDDEDVSVKEMRQYTAAGGGTLVDLSPIGLGRLPLALRRVSEATGVHIVMGSAWYRRKSHPKGMARRTVDDLAAELVREITVGVDDTGVRAGIIGEVGVHNDAVDAPLDPEEARSLRAAARASKQTGAAINVHMVGGREMRSQALDVLEDERTDLGRVVFSHSDLIAHDAELLRQLLERGVYVEFDLLGRTEAVPIPSRSDAVPDAILRMLAERYVQRLLLSQDFCMKWHLKRWGGAGYSWLPTRFLPYLKTLGVTEAQLNTIMFDNPKRLLTFAAVT